MDFKALREQILANIDNYSASEQKVVIIKLLDFLVDISDKRNKLEIENKQLFEDINSNKESHHQYKGKVDEIFERANREAKKIIDNANEIVIKKTEEAEIKSQEIINNTLDKLEDIVAEIKQLDHESKLYRNHIITMFKKTIFKFSDSKYYLIRSDDKDFNDLLNFFETDQKLQAVCEDNMRRLNNIKNYIEIRDSVENKVREDKPSVMEDFIQVEEINVEEKKFDISENEMVEIKKTLKEQKPLKDPSENQTVKKFIEIINKHNNK